MWNGKFENKNENKNYQKNDYRFQSRVRANNFLFFFTIDEFIKGR